MMIHWFMKRWRKNALLLGAPAAALAFILLATAGSLPPAESDAPDSDSDCISDAYELFFGLNINTNDAGLDYDNDALANYSESLKLSDPFAPDTDHDGFSDLIDSNAVSRAYIRLGDPKFTTGDQYEYAHPDWLLGAYKNGGEWVVDTATTQSAWQVSADGRSGVASLNIDLDRTILTNNLVYAIHYSAGSNASLYVDLLDTNGLVIAENLFGNLLVISNATHVIPAEAGIQSNNADILLNIPTAKFPAAAVIQLRACHSRGSGNPVLSVTDGFPIRSGMTEAEQGELFVYEGLLYIDEDNDGLDADQERQIGTSDYSIDSNGNGTNDYDECFNAGSSTNSPGNGGSGGSSGGNEPGGEDQKGIIYVDQALGNDAFTGRSPAISVNKGPKKTVRGGLSIAETNDTIIIRTGNYRENLDIRGKDVKVVIEGKVRL